MPRYHRVEDIIELALALQAPGTGLCLEDVQRRFEVGRRTAERMREAVDRIYPGMTSTKGADGRKYWRLSEGQANGLLRSHREELDALDHAIEEAREGGDAEGTRLLAAIRDKVETLVGSAPPNGESSAEGAAAMERLRRAIVLDNEVRLHCFRPDGERITAHVQPYGLLGGARLLLVATDRNGGRPRLVPIDEIVEVELLEASFERDPNVDLRRFGANAFVPFEQEPLELCWRFGPEAADDALEYEFHPEQEIGHDDDGSVEIRFRAESLVELAWHLFAWGDRVQVRDRPVLQHQFHAMMRRALEGRTAPGRARETEEPAEGPA